MERFFFHVLFSYSALLCFIPCSPAHTHFGLTNIHAGALYSCSSAELTVLRSLLAHFPAAARNFSHWQTSDDCCNWGPGFTCASDVPSTPTNKSSTVSDQWLHRRPLTGLVLDTTIGGSSSPLTYPIPSSLCNLSSLITLRLTRLSFSDQAYQIGGLSGSIPQCIGTHLTNLVELDLSDNSLTGPLPHSFSHLQSLQLLDLSDNSLSGPLPHSFSHLQSLRLLDLSSNSLTGPLPHSFSHLRSLRSLHLSNNDLSGGFFPSFGLNLRSLTTLDLSLNSFSGPLPSFSSPFLQSLSLSQNLFSGAIGDSALALDAPFKYLSYLDLSRNFLSGEMPAFDPSRFSSLASLYLEHNLLNGNVLSSICSLTNLTDLRLSSNSLSGSLLLSRQCREPMFSHHLAVLDVSDNEIEGPFPDWIGSLTNLEDLDLSYNTALSGSLPNSWQNLSRLHSLGLSGVNLVAPMNGSTSAPRLPAWCFSLPALHSLSIGSLDFRARDLHCSSVLLFLNRSSTYNFKYLDLSNNQLNSDGLLCLSNHSSYSASQSASLILSGNPLALDLNLPEAIQLLPPSLYMLDMSSCMLRGRLSGAFFDRIGATVQVLVLANNSLEGQVASHLGNLSSLRQLDLSSNYLEGQVPAEVSDNLGFRQLRWLDLSHNHLTGIAPSNIAAKLYSSLTSTDFVIRLSNNHLVGELSSLLENIFDINICPGILDVSYNFLTGSIPTWLQCAGSSAGAGFKFLFLHNNRLEGSIPNELFQNNQFLQVLSLRNNQLTGQIPQSIAFLTQLWVLDLSHNRLTGSLETSSLFGTGSSNFYTQLQVLLLSYNDFTGSVPLSSLAEIAPALQVIDLSNNHLTGMLPVHSLQSFSAFRTISTIFSAISHAGEDTDMFLDGIVITLKGNAQSYLYLGASSLIVISTLRGRDAVQSSWYFKGSLKGQILQIPSLDLSGNRLSGPISTGLGELSGLVSLNLSRNQFSGLIPSDLGKLSRQLQSLDLSYNELVGPIPPSFYNLTALEVFNVSYNPGLSGPIPQNQPQFERTESYIGDPNLCGNPILHSCSSAPEPEDQTPLPSADSGLSNKHNAFAEWIDEWVSIPGFCLGTVIGLVGTLPVLAYLYP